MDDPLTPYRRLLDERRDQILIALGHALGVDRREVLRRLGVADARQLRIAETAALKRRGRPFRTDLDKKAVTLALRETGGAIKPAAAKLGIPRMTLSRFAEREIPSWHYHYGEAVRLSHAEMLHKSAIAPSVAKARGYRSTDGGRELYKLGFGKANALTNRPGMLIPIWSVRGHVAWYQLRVDEPFKRWIGGPGNFRKTGKQRYANPRDAVAVLDVPPTARQRVLDSHEPLWITEGARKADAAASIDLACVAVLGVHGIPAADAEDWGYIGLDGRQVYVALDSDAARKPDVQKQERALVRLLEAKGARVTVVRLPEPRYAYDGKVGLDDFIAANGRDELLALVSKQSSYAP